MKPCDNPFRTALTDALDYEPVDLAWPHIMSRLAQLRMRGAIIGPHGSGKTTLMLAMGRRLSQQGFVPHHVFINDTAPTPTRSQWLQRLSAMNQRDVLLIDGGEYLPRFTWWRLRRAALHIAGLIVTTHRRRMLPTLVHTRTTPDLLTMLVHRLSPRDVRALPMHPRDLLTKHRGNMRDALRELYDYYALNPG